MATHLTEFEGKPLQSAANGELGLDKFEDQAEKEQHQKAADEFKALVEKINTVLQDKVKEVRVSERLTTSPACLVSETQDLGVHLERILKASGQKVPASKPILEINAGHPLVKRLKDETNDDRFNDWSHILFDQALLSEGGQLEDPVEFVRRLNNRLLELGA